MGTVYKRKRYDAKSVKWYVEYSYGGKRFKRLAIGARTKTEAKAFLGEIERQIYQGEYLIREKKKILFEVWAKWYLSWSKINKKSWKSDQTSMNHLIPFFKGKMLNNISPLMVEDYKNRRITKVKGSSLNRELSSLRKMLNIAIDEGLIKINPVCKVKFFPEHNVIERRLSQVEKDQLILKSKGYVKDAVIIALYTGMRKGEILNLEWKQVDFERGFIRVEKTKSGKSRTIPINSLVDEVLKALFRGKKQDIYVLWNPETKKPYNDIKRGFKKACCDAGINNLRFHDLRHNFASDLVENGVDIVTVSELLGHSDVNITAKRYSHPSPVHKKIAVEGLLNKKIEKSVELLPEILPDRATNRTN